MPALTIRPPDQRGDVHVLPVHDLFPHQESRLCWCRPDLYQEPDFPPNVCVVTHHSADGRELVELHGLQ